MSWDCDCLQLQSSTEDERDGSGVCTYLLGQAIPVMLYVPTYYMFVYVFLYVYSGREIDVLLVC